MPRSAALEWQARYVHAIARKVRALRDERGMSAQKLSDALESLGVPMERAVLSGWENGRRTSLDVTELLAVARVLEVAPAELLIPEAEVEGVEMLPGEHMTRAAALAWIAGIADPAVLDDLAAGLAQAQQAVERARSAVGAVNGHKPGSMPASAPTAPAVLTVEELAERERVKPSTIRTWIIEGNAPRHYTLGKHLHRFRLADVEAWEKSREPDPDLNDKYGDWDFENVAGVL